MNLITRNEWGARKPVPGSLAKIGSVYGCALHWNGPELLWPRDHSECYSLVRGIQNFHMDGRHWADIAYNALPCPHGFVFQGRWLGVRSAAQGTNSGNLHYYAICGLLGEHNEFTDDLIIATWDTINHFRQNGAGQEVKPHSAFHSTACPGPYRDWITQGMPLPVPPEPPPAPPQPPQPPSNDWLKETISHMETLDFRPVWNGAIITGAHVDNLQGLLKATMRADCDPGAIDGKGGAQTMGAVAAFQRIAGLTVDLVVGPATWNAIITW